MYKTNLILITDNEGGISKNGVIPWRFYQDLKYFKSKTEFGVVIMGRKTFESLKKPLNNRINIVITSSVKDDYDDDLFQRSA